MNRKTLPAVLACMLATLLSGCVQNQVRPEILEAAKVPLTCRDKAQCDLYWQRANIWVAAASTYRIQIANDSVIQTYGPFNNEPKLAFQVFRVPEESGAARILIKPVCGNLFGCPSMGVEEAAVAFKQFVRTGK